MSPIESFHKKETLSLVGRYATPTAAVVAGLGLILAPLEPGTRKLAAGLLAFSILFNLFFVPLSHRLNDGPRALLAKSRASVNLWLNVVLVLLLGRVWQPIWLLLTLSSVGTAIYGSRQRTVVTCLFLSFLLIVINLVLGLTTPLEWGLVLSKVSFIIFASLMINDLSRAKQEAP